MKIIKLFDPHVDHEEKVIKKILKSGFWASGAGIGAVSEFEYEFKKYTGAKECVAVNSGTAALHLALNLAEITKREVILPSLSFVSTAHAIKYNGGIPIFADIDENTLCVDYNAIEEKISPQTKIILPVHFGGMSCKLDEILKICKRENLKLIEDAAHAAGSSYANKKIGSHGNSVCFSFHPVKNLAMPSGGAITLNDKNSKNNSKILKSLRWCGISNRKGPEYDVPHLGWNYYMNEFAAEIGIIQLKKLERMNKRRKEIARIYQNDLQVKLKMPFDKDCSYHLYWIQVNDRNNLMKELKRNNIESGIHYKPIHQMTFYKNKKKLPITEKVAKKILSLPIHPNLSDSDVDKVIKIINKHYKLH
ncbi:MAG: glutamine--scyllo-inositol aminotransferase [Thaumarchaeota archaeon]|jgi:dTDP-4-amino-4,6-dideoxygalactose transaminase|nr:MAG: glutamine--scyllo-inositol aminotransferase [Nitrososphaerota archaeon]